MAKKEQRNGAYARLGYAQGKTIKQQILIESRFHRPGQHLTINLLLHHWICRISQNVTNPDNWREIKCPAEIEPMLTLQNQKHFGQAEALCLLLNRSNPISIGVPAPIRQNWYLKAIIRIVTSTNSLRYYLICSQELLTSTNSQPR